MNKGLKRRCTKCNERFQPTGPQTRQCDSCLSKIVRIKRKKNKPVKWHQAMTDGDKITGWLIHIDKDELKQLAHNHNDEPYGDPFTS